MDGDKKIKSLEKYGQKIITNNLILRANLRIRRESEPSLVCVATWANQFRVECFSHISSIAITHVSIAHIPLCWLCSENIWMRIHAVRQQDDIVSSDRNVYEKKRDPIIAIANALHFTNFIHCQVYYKEVELTADFSFFFLSFTQLVKQFLCRQCYCPFRCYQTWFFII